MKALYKSILVISLSITSLSITAQKDSTLIRQVLLEREYNPTLQDASKINTMPSIYSPEIKAKEFNFVSSSPRILLNHNRLGSADPEDIKTNVDFSKKRGYLNLGAGTNANLEGAAGYRIVNTAADRLDIFATHSSTSGTVDFIDGEQYIMDNAKAKYSASKINLKYQHTFAPSILSLDASFFNTSFNYYGNTFLPKETANFPYDITSRQNVDVFNIGAGLRASDTNEGILKYAANVRYQNFNSKYGITNEEEGPKGGQLDLDVDFFAEFGADKTVGVKGFIMNQSFSNKHRINLSDETFHGFTNITATPYFRIEGANWNVNLGFNASALFDVKNKLYVSPNIKAEVHVNEVNTFYGEITGGVNNNTFLDILQENRYVNLSSRVQYSKTPFDIKGGFKSGVINGFEFDIFAGYKKTNDDHLYYRNNLIDATIPIYELNYFGNKMPVMYADISTGHVGGLIKTKLIPSTDLSAKISAYFYDVKHKGLEGLGLEEKAWGRPTFTAEFNADVKPVDELTLSLNYQYGGGRKSLLMDYVMDYIDNALIVSTSKMKDINELNFRGEYQITDWASVNIRLNNILNQKYELQYGYTLQGFNVLGGLGFKF